VKINEKNNMHKHLYIKKNTRKVYFKDVYFLTVKYECLCGDWLKRRIRPDEIAPKYWIWDILSDQPVRLEQIPASPTL
jgi:hypothetical protein